jgi:monoamine oxidase
MALSTLQEGEAGCSKYSKTDGPDGRTQLSPFAAGAFTMFKPFQETELSPYISTPEGRVHFAGEHASDYHGWIQGAIQSAIRVAVEINKITMAG